jgi:argininosuccinate lyase
MPAGRGGLGGNRLPHRPHMTAKALGFDRPTANSLDSVSDRDFALEFLSASSICAMHLSALPKSW